MKFTVNFSYKGYNILKLKIMFILNIAHQWYIIRKVVIIIYSLFTLMHFVSTNAIHTLASTGTSQFALSACEVPRCTPICASAWNNILAGLRDWGQGYQQWSQLTILHSPANELRWRHTQALVWLTPSTPWLGNAPFAHEIEVCLLWEAVPLVICFCRRVLHKLDHNCIFQPRCTTCTHMLQHLSIFVEVSTPVPQSFIRWLSVNVGCVGFFG